jgi:hypothetical protein
MKPKEVSLIHDIINNISKSFKFSHHSKIEFDELIYIFEDNLIYSINDLYYHPLTDINTIQMSDDIRNLLNYYYQNNINFNVIHFFKVLGCRVEYENFNKKLKDIFEKYYVNLCKTELDKQLLFKHGSELNTVNYISFKSISVYNYLCFLNYDEYYLKELLDNCL